RVNAQVKLVCNLDLLVSRLAASAAHPEGPPRHQDELDTDAVGQPPLAVDGGAGVAAFLKPVSVDQPVRFLLPMLPKRLQEHLVVHVCPPPLRGRPHLTACPPPAGTRRSPPRSSRTPPAAPPPCRPG